jgi:hypothetical protein
VFFPDPPVQRGKKLRGAPGCHREAKRRWEKTKNSLYSLSSLFFSLFYRLFCFLFYCTVPPQFFPGFEFFHRKKLNHVPKIEFMAHIVTSSHTFDKMTNLSKTPQLTIVLSSFFPERQNDETDLFICVIASHTRRSELHLANENKSKVNVKSNCINI